MKIYNTMSKRKEEFVPLEEGKVKMYVCGPTVYNFAHIGNLRTYLMEDVLDGRVDPALPRPVHQVDPLADGADEQRGRVGPAAHHEDDRRRRAPGGRLCNQGVNHADIMRTQAPLSPAAPRGGQSRR